MAIKLTAEETAELYRLREPTPVQLADMARRCGHDVTIKDDLVTMKDYHIWNPSYKPAQNHELLATLIIEGDCRLFYDHEVGEFFIYRYPEVVESTSFLDDPNPPLAHNASLDATVVEAALNLWFPED